MEKHQGIGIMSGTSHDGLDLAHCIFTKQNDSWSFSIEKAVTIPYPVFWRERLLNLHKAVQEDIDAADHDLGTYIGKQIKEFILEYGLEVDFVASHGHTVFHKPDEKLTLQIGKGKQIAEHCGVMLVNDFRSKDVQMGGQGAPLVPVGDRLLFKEHTYCLNLGGIANISFEDKSRRLAFDICPANMVLNVLAEQAGKPYDDKGAMGAKGKVIQSLLDKLESLDYYSMSGPRSLGREWVEEHVFPLLNIFNDHPIPDLLATFTEHIAIRIAAVLKTERGSMLVSGGGAYNEYLIQRMKHHSRVDIIVPENIIIDYKEAMIFAFLGLLRIQGANNVLASVTGVPHDHCSGEIIYPR